MSDQLKNVKKLPTPEEIDAMTVFPPGDPECAVLCDDVRDTAEELQSARGLRKWLLTARLKALNRRMHELHCPLCLPE